MPKGAYRTPRWVQEAEQQFLQEQEARRQREANASATSTEPPKIGVDPTVPHHPILNPTAEELRRRDQYMQESAVIVKERQRTPTQEQYWKAAIALIKEGKCQSYEALGKQFARSKYDRKAPGQPFTAVWAYHLVRKLIVRGVFTQEEIRRLIPDQTRPFKTKRTVSTQPNDTGEHNHVCHTSSNQHSR